VPIRHADAIRRERPDAEVVVIERARHVPMIERPDSFAATLLELLERLPKHATTPPALISEVP
jgi:pimeloyl-ACP methyl ester carboxylesterase